MTNGEKIQTILDVDRDCTEVHGENGTMTFTVTQDFWNAEYKGPTAKNDLGVDCISRQAVIDLMMQKWGENFSGDNAMQESIDAIREMPSVTPQEPRWIPVEEKTPKDGQSVLFCDIDNDIMIGYHIKGRPNTHFSQDGTYEDIKNVRAWMPLPQAYRKVEE